MGQLTCQSTNIVAETLIAFDKTLLCSSRSAQTADFRRVTKHFDSLRRIYS
jgi:hypothetical protein